jgi:hypothetical protein
MKITKKRLKEIISEEVKREESQVRGQVQNLTVALQQRLGVEKLLEEVLKRVDGNIAVSVLMLIAEQNQDKENGKKE